MNNFKAFMRAKGFYLALLACILAAALSSFWAIRSMTQHLGGENSTSMEDDALWELPEEPVDQNVTDIPVLEEKPATSSQPSSSQSGAQQQQTAPPASSEPAAPSEPVSVQPVSGQITAIFSGDELVYSETLGDWRTHNGVDIACEAGATVKACRGGTVTAVYEDGLWGKVVELEADGVVFRYTGLADVSVKTDAQVAAGDSLGKVGETYAEALDQSHLHLEVLKGGAYVDPQNYFG